MTKKEILRTLRIDHDEYLKLKDDLKKMQEDYFAKKSKEIIVDDAPTLIAVISPIVGKVLFYLDDKGIRMEGFNEKYRLNLEDMD